jgi:3'(2'), 5'-bisphosphate nucleotidase
MSNNIKPNYPLLNIDLAELIMPVVNLAIEAGENILTIYSSNFSVNHKNDNSPLTAADLASHECLVAGLRRLPGAYPVLSEESVELPFEQRRLWETYWLVDPLDGTKEFIKRNGEFTVNIALIHRTRPVLGVVYAPVARVSFFSSFGAGAYKMVGEGKPTQISARRHASNPPVVVSSRSHQTEEMKAYLLRLGACVLKSVGSSLKFCLVAEGEADLYPRLGLTSEWDTAAAHCIVESAGGKVTTLRGEALLYNTKPSLLNPFFLAFGDESRDWGGFAEGIRG